MSQLDTATKFHCSNQSATQESLGSIEVRPLRDGKFEVVAEEATKKWDGKKWHSRTVFLTLSADQITKLKEALG